MPVPPLSIIFCTHYYASSGLTVIRASSLACIMPYPKILSHGYTGYYIYRDVRATVAPSQQVGQLVNWLTVQKAVYLHFVRVAHDHANLCRRIVYTWSTVTPAVRVLWP